MIAFIDIWDIHFVLNDLPSSTSEFDLSVCRHVMLQFFHLFFFAIRDNLLNLYFTYSVLFLELQRYFLADGVNVPLFKVESVDVEVVVVVAHRSVGLN